MKRLLCASIVLLGCDSDTAGHVSNDSTPIARDTISSPRKSGDGASSGREIYIDSIAAGNPIVVSGRARTFENTVQVRARDARGDVITEEFTTSVGEMGHHNPYTAQLWITRDPGPQVTVEAFEYSAEDGSVRSLTSQAIPYDVDRTTATLHFPVGDDCTRTAAFTRRIPKSVGVARLLAEALVAGPDSAERSAGAVSSFPKGSDVRSVVRRNGTIVVDFSERLQNVGGACAASAIRQSVTNTLGLLPGVTSVQITAAGSEKLALQP